MKSTDHISTPILDTKSAPTLSSRMLREPVLILLLVVDFLLFVSGALAHRGIPIPLGFTAWTEPVIIPASNVESSGALVLGIALASVLLGAAGSRRWVLGALWICFAGTLWGMNRLAVGAIPEARTVSNDFLHIAMVLVTTLALVRVASRRDPEDAPQEASDEPQ
jgi:hypothetical protein